MHYLIYIFVKRETLVSCQHTKCVHVGMLVNMFVNNSYKHTCQHGNVYEHNNVCKHSSVFEHRHVCMHIVVFVNI